MRTGVPVGRLLIQVVEGSSPLLLHLKRHRVRKVPLEHLGRIDHAPEMVRLDPIEKLLEAEDMLQLAGALYRAGRHDHAEPDDGKRGEDGRQDSCAQRKVEEPEALTEERYSHHQEHHCRDAATYVGSPDLIRAMVVVSER